jgi:hypothetical protein
MNLLETNENVEDYEKWLSTKSFHYLKCILGNLLRDKKREKPMYANLPLRIELVSKEMKKKQTLDGEHGEKGHL